MIHDLYYTVLVQIFLYANSVFNISPPPSRPPLPQTQRTTHRPFLSTIRLTPPTFHNLHTRVSFTRWGGESDRHPSPFFITKKGGDLLFYLTLVELRSTNACLKKDMFFLNHPSLSNMDYSHNPGYDREGRAKKLR
nr:hypothetical protein [Morchella crassipes]